MLSGIRRPKHLPALLLLLGLSALLASCGPATLYKEKKEFPDAAWAYADSLTFKFNSENTHMPYNLVLGLKVNGEAYPYRNLWLKFRVHLPNGKETSVMREFVLADAEGNWNVEGSGGSYRFEQALRQNVVLDLAGTYTVTVVQYMRDDVLKGVEELSFAVEEAE